MFRLSFSMKVKHHWKKDRLRLERKLRTEMRSDDKSSFYGDATNFGGLYDQIRYNQALEAGKTEQQALKVGDPGIGTPRLGTINTASHYGVAVPTDVLRANFGNDQSA